MMFSNATGYESYLGPWSSSLAPRFIDFADIHDGDRVLDVGSGTGSLALALAASMSGVEIVGIDPSISYIQFAATRAKDPRARFHVGDAVNLPYRYGYFDKSLAQLVLSFIDDVHRAVAEMCRVARAGGIVAACVWSSERENERTRIFWEAAIAIDPAASQQHERPAGYEYGARGRLSALWRDCGLKSIKEAHLVSRVDFASFDEFWLPYLEGQGHAAAYVRSLSPDRRDALRECLRHHLLGKKGEAPFSLRAQAVAVRGIC